MKCILLFLFISVYVLSYCQDTVIRKYPYNLANVTYTELSTVKPKDTTKGKLVTRAVWGHWLWPWPRVITTYSGREWRRKKRAEKYIIHDEPID